MLVDVVTHMEGDRLRLMLAVRRSRRPDELGGQQEHQSKEKPASHRGGRSMKKVPRDLGPLKPKVSAERP